MPNLMPLPYPALPFSSLQFGIFTSLVLDAASTFAADKAFFCVRVNFRLSSIKIGTLSVMVWMPNIEAIIRTSMT